jgi:hypothetical protein
MDHRDASRKNLLHPRPRGGRAMVKLNFDQQDALNAGPAWHRWRSPLKMGRRGAITSLSKRPIRLRRTPLFFLGGGMPLRWLFSSYTHQLEPTIGIEPMTC